MPLKHQDTLSASHVGCSGIPSGSRSGAAAVSVMVCLSAFDESDFDSLLPRQIHELFELPPRLVALFDQSSYYLLKLGVRSKPSIPQFTVIPLCLVALALDNGKAIL